MVDASPLDCFTIGTPFTYWEQYLTLRDVSYISLLLLLLLRHPQGVCRYNSLTPTPCPYTPCTLSLSLSGLVGVCGLLTAGVFYLLLRDAAAGEKAIPIVVVVWRLVQRLTSVLAQM